jgi:HEAT repeat protein
VQVLLRSSDPRVRALAAEVAGDRRNPRYAADLVEGLNDNEPAVRRAAHTALVRLLGTDVSPGQEGAAAQEKWREALRARGWLG